VPRINSRSQQSSRAIRIGRRLFAIAPICLSLTGCGGPGYSSGAASGEVRIDGVAVPHGFITFTPTAKDQGPVVGAPIEDGKYRCERVPVGKLTVTFVAEGAEQTTVYDVATKTEHKIPKNILPSAYSGGLPVEMIAGDNRRDFDLKSSHR
jgi:hypothetical protein